MSLMCTQSHAVDGCELRESEMTLWLTDLFMFIEVKEAYSMGIGFT